MQKKLVPLQRFILKFRHLFLPKTLFRIPSSKYKKNLLWLSQALMQIAAILFCNMCFIILGLFFQPLLYIPSAHYQRSIQIQQFPKAEFILKGVLLGQTVDTRSLLSKLCQLQIEPPLLHLPYAVTVNRLKVKCA